MAMPPSGSRVSSAKVAVIAVETLPALSWKRA